MPSYFESLSMVALEAWALGRPVLANARCDVLKGQCIRSNAGLYYDDRRRIRRIAARDRTQPLAGRQPRQERPPVLSRPLRLAGHRAQVSRHASSACRNRRRCDTHRSAARVVRASAEPTARPAPRWSRPFRRTVDHRRRPYAPRPQAPVSPPLPRRARSAERSPAVSTRSTAAVTDAGTAAAAPGPAAAR